MENKNNQKREISQNNSSAKQKNKISDKTIKVKKSNEYKPFNISDYILKKNKIYNDIMSHSSNRNSNLNAINNFSNFSNNKNISVSAQDFHRNKIKDKENSKINELINKFNTLYHSYNDNDNNYKLYYLTNDKKFNNDNNKYSNYKKINKENTSFDNIYTRKSNHINSKSNKNQNNRMINLSDKKKIITYKKNINLKNYSIKKNYKTSKNSPEEKNINKRYQNQNNDNNSQQLSTISIKSNIVLNKYKKKGLDDENNTPKLKYSIRTYTGLATIENSTTNNSFNYNHLKLNSTDNIKNNKIMENDDIFGIQNENIILNKKNIELIRKYESVKIEKEKKEKENKELKYELENKKKEICEKNNNIENLEKEIKYLKNIVNINNKSQIDFSNKIQESKKDNDHLIGELNNTIENLQKINLENKNKIIKLKNEIEDFKNKYNSKQNEISLLNENINKSNLLINNKDNRIKELNDMINEMQNKSEENQKKMNDVIIENEKIKNEVIAIELLLTDRENTISAQKNTISFLTENFNKNINLINKNINDAIMNNEIQNNDKGLKIIVEKMQKEIDSLNKKNNIKEQERMKLEKELLEYNNQFEEIKHEYELLYQKYTEQNKIIEIIKKESLKNNNENELQHLTKVNFDILGKLKTTQNDNIIKTKQLEQLKKNYELINDQFIEFEKKNCYNISDMNSDFKNNDNTEKEKENTLKIANTYIQKNNKNNGFKENDYYFYST